MAIRASHFVSSLLFACAATAAHAVELGDARVASHIGQPLAASVELSMIEDSGATVGVRLAHPDVYRGANIAMPAVLSSLGMQVIRRDGRQFLQLTTGKPVEGRHLHVYLELLDGGQRSVRLVTLWLTPDPIPAPVPVPASADIAPRKPAPAARPVAALYENEEYVEPRKPVAKAAAVPPRKPVERKAARAAVAPALAAEARHTPGTCPAPPAAEQPAACAVLGKKNDALRQELGQLEAKVKVLQVAAGSAAAIPASAPAAMAPVPAAAPAPKGAPRIQLKAKKPVPPPEPETSWGLIAGAIVAAVALAGLAAALLRRRQRASFGKIPKEHKPAGVPPAETALEQAAGEGAPKPSFMSAVKARLMPGARKGAPPPAVEPALDGVES